MAKRHRQGVYATMLAVSLLATTPKPAQVPSPINQAMAVLSAKPSSVSLGTIASAMESLTPSERVVLIASLGALGIPAERRRQLQRDLRSRVPGVSIADEVRALRTTTASLTAVLHELQIYIPSTKYAQIMQNAGCEGPHDCFPDLAQLRASIANLERFLSLYPSGELASHARKTIAEFVKRKKALERQELRQAPLHIEDVRASKNSIGIPTIELTLTNTSQSEIDAISVEIRCYDRFGRSVKYLRSNTFKGLAQPDSPIVAGGFYEPAWVLHGFDIAAVFKARIVEAHFSDGRTWRAGKGAPLVEGRL